MLTIIHNYHPVYIRGLMEHGMFQKGDGLKITQHWATPENMKFNKVAAVGGPLHRLVQEMCGCFYIDRLQGGTFISRYPFDLALAEEYDRITEGNFLGYQLHESGNTRALDWNRIKTQLQNNGLSWSLENILSAVTKVSHNKDFPHFSNGHPEEYAALTPPETLSEYTGDLRDLWRDRQKKFAGKILNCDAGYMLCGLEKDADVQVSFIEVGAQTGRSRIMFALRRGISRARGKKWGVYHEPWGSSPCTAYCFMEDKTNEWDLDVNNAFFSATDGNGGSSMSLFRRIMYYALFGGADYFAEEWGMANTFTRWDPFVLSPYGKIKKDFLDVSRRFTDVKPYTPIAFVIPHEYALFNVWSMPSFENDLIPPEYWGISDRIAAYFDDGRHSAMEDYAFESGGWGSLFDIIYDDSYAAPEKEYRLLIDFTGRLHGDCVADGNDRNAADKAIAEITASLPFTLEDGGKSDYQLFTSNGETYLAVYNHKGINKTQEKGECGDPDADLPFTLRTKNGRYPECINLCSCPTEAKDGGISVILRAGELVLFRL